MKISDKMVSSIKEGKKFFSFEFFPPKTDEGVENLFERMDRMVSYGPTFCDITWGAGGSTASLTLDIAARMQNQICVETMMHLTCTNMKEEMLMDALSKCKEEGISNILALRGDPPHGQEKFEVAEGGFACALDLVKYIRKEFGDYFGIAVAGYPEAHPDVITGIPDKDDEAYWSDIRYLKQKVDAGGEFIVTQLFYETDRFLKFVEDCRGAGITVPIIPGIMPIMTYNGFKRMTGFCKTKVPQDITDTLESIKDNEEAIKNYGIELGYNMCKQLLEAGTPGLHMYTLNLDRSSVGILRKLGLVDELKVERPLPWRPAASVPRNAETVRPVFWANRRASYLERTAAWESFPAGTWKAGGEYAALPATSRQMKPHSFSEKRRANILAAWGTSLGSMADVKAAFVKYCKGEVAALPWSGAAPLAAESASIAAPLAALCERELLTVNSQPAANGTPSGPPGWGPAGGYLYQKAMVEFFCSPAALAELMPKLDAAPSVSYIAASASGDLHTNYAPGAVNALTWGVFPGAEVCQPTVADVESFKAWKDEAFGLWTSEWAALYEKDSPSAKLLASVQESYYLVSVVENDYVNGDLFKVLA